MKVIKLHMFVALFLSLILVSCSNEKNSPLVYGFDFKVGDIYYNITSETELTVEVTHYTEENRLTTNPPAYSSYSGNVSIPSTVTKNGEQYTVTRIGDYAFSGSSKLTSVEIPSSITSIGECAFYKCSGLTAVMIPSSVTSIGDFAFSYCSGLTAITIPDSVTYLGGGAFSECGNLISVVFPDSMDRIIAGTFRNCTSLPKIVIPDPVTDIGRLAFSGCTNLSEITMSESLADIGERAFWGCEKLMSMTIPDSVTNIGEGAFAYCECLAEITIGKSVKTIDLHAFCSYNIRKIYSLNPDAPTCSGLVFSKMTDPLHENVIYENSVLYVPQGTKVIYSAAEEWGKFFNIEELE